MKNAVMFACFAIAVSVFAEAVYENDLSTRTSKGVVPSGEWREVAYEQGPLVNANYAESEIFRDGGLQDNWGKGRNGCNANASVVDDAGNPMALAFYNSSDKTQHVILKHRLGNIFTSGIVTAQCDIRPPVSWGSYDPKTVRLYLGDEDFFSPETDSEKYLWHVAAGAGITYHNDSNTYRFWQYGATDLSVQPVSMQGGSGWFRVVISANLGTKTFDVSVYELGGEHPTLDTPTPATPAYTASGCTFYNKTKGVSLSSISAIGIGGYGVAGTTDDRARTAQFDNLRVWHDGVECYSNDFSTRRSRRLDTGSKVAQYAATSLATNTLAYARNATLSMPLNTRMAVQPVGVDGWRRVNNAENSLIDLKVEAYTNNNAALLDWRGNQNWYGTFVQPLGRTFTSGKVRCCVDMTYVNGIGSSGNFTVFLGNDTLYSARNDGYQGGYFARAGIHAEVDGRDDAGNSKRKPYYFSSTDGTGENRASVKAAGASVALKWLRIEITADLDANKYDYSLYYVCPASQSPAYGAAVGECLFSMNGIWRANAVDEISCFALSDYKGWVYFDNLSVWHSPSSSEVETLVYSNTFTERKVYLQDCCEDRLVGTIKKNPEGMDAWMRLGRADADVMLVDDGANAAIAFADNNTENASWAVHDLGESFESGKMTATFDILAPSIWAKDSGRAAVWIGGGQFREGNLSGGEYGFEKWAICGAGISNSTFAAWSGDGSGGGAWATAGAATAGHWYRFAVKASLDCGTSDVSVYDMGTEQPALSAAVSGNAVATFAALPHRRLLSQAKSVSCVGVEAYGVSNGSILKGDARLMVGNLRITHKPSGFTLIFR